MRIWRNFPIFNELNLMLENLVNCSENVEIRRTGEDSSAGLEFIDCSEFCSWVTRGEKLTDVS